jgi:hypothetical protein
MQHFESFLQRVLSKYITIELSKHQEFWMNFNWYRLASCCISLHHVIICLLFDLDSQCRIELYEHVGTMRYKLEINENIIWIDCNLRLYSSVLNCTDVPRVVLAYTVIHHGDLRSEVVVGLYKARWCYSCALISRRRWGSSAWVIREDESVQFNSVSFKALGTDLDALAQI